MVFFIQRWSSCFVMSRDLFP